MGGGCILAQYHQGEPLLRRIKKLRTLRRDTKRGIGFRKFAVRCDDEVHIHPQQQPDASLTADSVSNRVCVNNRCLTKKAVHRLPKGDADSTRSYLDRQGHAGVYKVHSQRLAPQLPLGAESEAYLVALVFGSPSANPAPTGPKLKLRACAERQPGRSFIVLSCLEDRRRARTAVVRLLNLWSQSYLMLASALLIYCGVCKKGPLVSTKQQSIALISQLSPAGCGSILALTVYTHLHLFWFLCCDFCADGPFILICTGNSVEFVLKYVWHGRVACTC